MSTVRNDMLDVRAVLSGLDKILKTEIAASSGGSNVAYCEPAPTSRPPPPQTPTASVQPPQSQLLNTTILPSTPVLTPNFHHGTYWRLRGPLRQQTNEVRVLRVDLNEVSEQPAPLAVHAQPKPRWIALPVGRAALCPGYFEKIR